METVVLETITNDEVRLIEQVRRLRPFDKIIIAKNQNSSKVTVTIIRQDQLVFDTLLQRN